MLPDSFIGAEGLICPSLLHKITEELPEYSLSNIKFRREGSREGMVAPFCDERTKAQYGEISHPWSLTRIEAKLVREPDF